MVESEMITREMNMILKYPKKYEEERKEKWKTERILNAKPFNEKTE